MNGNVKKFITGLLTEGNGKAKNTATVTELSGKRKVIIETHQIVGRPLRYRLTSTQGEVMTQWRDLTGAAQLDEFFERHGL